VLQQKYPPTAAGSHHEESSRGMDGWIIRTKDYEGEQLQLKVVLKSEKLLHFLPSFNSISLSFYVYKL
jgi:hypothetical protein